MERYVMVSAILVLALGGCGSSSSSEGTTDPATASAPALPSESPSVSDSGNCRTAAVDGDTNNSDLQALAYDVYSSLECGTGESLSDQLKAAQKNPGFEANAEAAGLTVSVDSAAGGTVMSLVVDTSGCNITVLDSADAKSLSCLDL